MAFLKFKADQVFTGNKMIGGDHVLITDEKGVIQEIVNENQAGENVQTLNGLLSPAFINCHCHLELSHMKGLIPEKTGLVDFVFKVVTQRHFPEAEILRAIETTEAGMLQSGTVAVGDICNNLSTLPQKLRGNLYYQNFIEVSGWLPSVAQIRFERSKSFYDDFQKHFPSSTLVPHAPYSVSQQLWQRMETFFQNKIVTIHNQETIFEDEFFKLGSGDFVRMYQMMNIDNSFFVPSEKTSVQTYFSNFKNASGIILVHSTFSSEEDVQFANREAANNNQLLNWCICINANQYIEDVLPPVELLRSNICNIVMGTDSLASNHSLDMLEELKTLHRHFPSISLQEMLKWATINGANALEIDETFGSFEKGKTPGLVLIKNVENNHLSSTSSSLRIL